MPPITLFLIIFSAFFTLGLTGFGHALVAMPLLTPLVGLPVAAPLVALASLAGEVVTFVRYRSALNFRTVRRLITASLIGIPIGVLGLRYVDAHIGLTILGVIAAGYGLYSLLNLRLPEIQHPNWAYGFGFAAGLLVGAYNTGGPPVVIYGTCRRWKPAEFKGNLQGMFLLNSTLVVTVHALSGNLTPTVLENFLIALPAIGAGLLAGFVASRYINPVIFRKIVLVMLVILGLRLILT